jgi:prolipoprotein diacylglyceryltransferase
VFPSEPLHPSQLYLAAAGIGQFALLLALDRKKHFDGWLFWTYIAIDATFRFLIDFTRYYDATSYLGKIGPLSFNVNQIFSVFLVAASVFMLLRLRHAGTTTAALSPMPEANPGGPAPDVEAAEAAPAHRDPTV